MSKDGSRRKPVRACVGPEKTSAAAGTYPCPCWAQARRAVMVLGRMVSSSSGCLIELLSRNLSSITLVLSNCLFMPDRKR
eukprot:760573-Hanusia_phi.AAC.3